MNGGIYDILFSGDLEQLHFSHFPPSDPPPLLPHTDPQQVDQRLTELEILN